MSFRPDAVLPGALRRAGQLPWSELRGFLNAYVGLAATDLLLRLRGFERMASLSPERDRSATVALTAEQRRAIQSYVRWIDAASRYHLLPARCLHRSLLLHRRMQRDGLPSELRIGVRLEQGEVQAHAWVELGGQAVNDSAASVADFARLQPISSPGTGHGVPAALTPARGGTSR